MAIVITTSNGEKVFTKDTINIGTNPNCDVILNLGYDVLLTLQCLDGKYSVTNNFQSEKFCSKDSL